MLAPHHGTAIRSSSNAPATPSYAANCWDEPYTEGSDGTGGAYAYGCTTYPASDGGTMLEVYVEDRKADGKCAHAALRWLHDNGEYYYDYGMYVCGLYNGAQFTKGPRNSSLYQKVDLQVFVDDGPVSTYLIQYF